ncbi:hypothetical protein JTE90_003990 [Oedothorax gibbosus]|uniref:Uncharacterized protein n=1 Tax=Oedothorax gibbosus TaxID=931172 RepID=A0AAV6UDM3_9ARAC|nr:hypothetical protein JTE90_003990 [Oedothorax gibbosus]
MLEEQLLLWSKHPSLANLNLRITSCSGSSLSGLSGSSPLDAKSTGFWRVGTCLHWCVDVKSSCDSVSHKSLDLR